MIGIAPFYRRHKQSGVNMVELKVGVFNQLLFTIK
jgi:hypothetical protein